MIPLPDFTDYACLSQAHLDWFKRQGVPVTALFTSIDDGNPTAIRVARGHRAEDGRFEDDPAGPQWLAFEEPEDVVYWNPRVAKLATRNGRAFALGEDAITNPGTYAFDNRLDIYPDPLTWLRAKRDGIVILDWSRAWSRLQDAPRVGVSESLFATYSRHMRPPAGPEVFVLKQERMAA
jgi:hypothetical protein